MIRVIAAGAILLMAAIPMSIKPSHGIAALALLGAVLSGLGFAIRQLRIVLAGALAALVALAISLSMTGGPAFPVRGLAFGLAVVAALDATGFELRRSGAVADSAVVRAQTMFWLLRGLLAVICAIGLLALGNVLATVLPLWLAPIVLATGGLMAFVAATGMVFARRSD